MLRRRQYVFNEVAALYDEVRPGYPPAIIDAAIAQARLPSGGRILEIGCGRGLLCTYLALSRPTRSVLGVDIDPARIGQAQQVARTLPNLDLDYGVAESGRVPAGPWDAILVVDMLYLLPVAQQRELLTAAAAELAPGGLVLVKEMSAAPWYSASPAPTAAACGSV